MTVKESLEKLRIKHAIAHYENEVTKTALLLKHYAQNIEKSEDKDAKEIAKNLTAIYNVIEKHRQEIEQHAPQYSSSDSY